MNRLSKEDLAQMNRDYFQSLDKQKLVEVAENLHQLAVEQLEKLEQNSGNSSLPPSSDHFKSPKKSGLEEEDPSQESESQTELKQEKNLLSEEGTTPKNQELAKKKPGKQPGSQGRWRTKPLVASQTIPHYPLTCASCNSALEIDPQAKPHMGYYVLELEKLELGIEVKCTLHHYYQATCTCGHQTKEKPLVGYISVVEGRSRDLCLQEYGLVGPMLATFIASLGIRYRISRPKIRELLNDWVGVSLSVGTIDRCIREVGIACSPVVEELIEQLQSAEIIHLDETSWYEKGKYRWLWVAIT
ncbi:transposase, partial [Dolichospermum sp. UHCC 0259]